MKSFSVTPLSVTLFALLLSSGVSQAQSRGYRPFKFDITTGYSRLSDAGDLSGGFNFSLEPKFNITDQIAAGLKVEFAFLGLATSGSETLLAATQGTQLTGEYYFGESTVRPYVGLGLGVFKNYIFYSDSDTDESEVYTGDSQFGFSPRAGLQIGHFRLGAEYNLVKDANYFSVKIGATIGGGRK